MQAKNQKLNMKHLDNAIKTLQTPSTRREF